MSKTVNGEKWTYQYVNGKLLHETRGQKEFAYFYDANGFLTAIKYKLTPTGTEYVYYATHNWRGDVIGLYNGNGTLVAAYEYDSWGNVLDVLDANGNRITSSTHVGNLNPFRYRGYYQDTETGLYYLLSRYYDPVTHRFVNADGYFQAGQGILDTNMSIYCRNNPGNFFDPTGSVVFVNGVEAKAAGIAAISGSVIQVADLHGNVGYQTSYTGFDAGASFGILGISGGRIIGIIWDAETIYDLEKPCDVVGVTAGPGWYIGGDFIYLSDSLDDQIDGVFLAAGGAVGLPIDVNIAKPKTTTIWSTNIFENSNQKNSATKNAPTPKKQSQSCSGCGRPIGTKPGQCGGGWTY